MKLLTAAFLAFSLSCGLSTAHAADPDKPHAHKGVLKPYPSPPQAVALSADQEAKLEKGKPVYTQVQQGTGGRGVAVFVVDAPPAKVWSTISSFSSYPQWIDGVSRCEVYKQAGDYVYVDFEIGKMGMNVQYFIKHYYPKGQTWGTWTLDYDRESDLDDSVGTWRVVPYNGDANRSRVEYSVDIRVSGWVPGFVRDMLVDQGLKDATKWVGEQSG